MDTEPKLVTKGDLPDEIEDLSRRIIGCAIGVHSAVGSGLNAALLVASLCVLSGCTTPRLHASKTDSELHDVLAADFPVGMGRTAAWDRLLIDGATGVSCKWEHWPPPTPCTLTATLKGGHECLLLLWSSGAGVTLEFDDNEQLMRASLHRWSVCP